MSYLGETYLLDEIKMLQKGYHKYFSLDEEDYIDWQDMLNKNDVLIVPEYRKSFLFYFFKEKSSYRVYLDTEDNQDKIAKYLRNVSRKNKKKFFQDLVALFFTLLLFGIIIYFWILEFQLYY